MIKKLFALLSVLAAALCISVSAQADQRIPNSEVPAGLKTFVKDTFGKDVNIVWAERDREFGGYEYDVRLSNGAEVTYGVSNEWMEVDCENANTNVPTEVLGDQISQHISVTYPGQAANKIERKKAGYEVTLTNGRELFYNNNGQFVREDK